MSNTGIKERASSKTTILKPTCYALAIVLAISLVEVLTRFYYSKEQLLYLPYYSLSKDHQNLLIWQNQPNQQDVGTITTPYAFDVYNSMLGWKVKPNVEVKHSKPGFWNVTIKTNTYGLRGDKLQRQHNARNIAQIGVIGASQTFGESVNDNEGYVSLLDSKLKNYEVLNFGVRGYGTDQMLLYYKDVARSYDLDIVILAFAFHHMPRNISSFTFYAKPYFIKDGNELHLAGSPVPSEFELYDEEISHSTQSILNKSVLMRLALQYFKTKNENKMYNKDSEVWEITKLIITRFAKLVKQNNSSLILLNIEHKHENLEPALQVLADDLGVELINLGPMLREVFESGVGAQIPNDNHWSATGHQFVADAIYEQLCSNRMIIACD